MANKYNGGPVFPCAVTSAAKEQAKSVGIILEDYTGITLRDYFAAKSITGLLAQSEGGALTSDLDIGAKFAYEMADAMLKAREQ